MHVVVVGCGRAGSVLVRKLDAEGDEVAAVDVDRRARDRLPAAFGGTFHPGSGLRRDVLEAAGIGRADAFVSLTSSDSVNLVTTRLARDVYHVPRVAGRLHDAERAPVANLLGLPVVTSVTMTVDRVHRMLRHRRLAPEHTFGDGESVLVREPVPDWLAGRNAGEFAVPGEIHLVEITRAGHSFVAEPDSVLRRGDLASFVVASGSLARLHGFLGERPD